MGPIFSKKIPKHGSFFGLKPDFVVIVSRKPENFNKMSIYFTNLFLAE